MAPYSTRCVLRQPTCTLVTRATWASSGDLRQQRSTYWAGLSLTRPTYTTGSKPTDLPGGTCVRLHGGYSDPTTSWTVPPAGSCTSTSLHSTKSSLDLRNTSERT